MSYPLKTAAEKLGEKMSVVRSFIKAHPDLAPPKAFGETGPYICSAAWVTSTRAMLDAEKDHRCLSCGWKPGEPLTKVDAEPGE